MHHIKADQNSKEACLQNSDPPEFHFFRSLAKPYIYEKLIKPTYVAKNCNSITFIIIRMVFLLW